MAEEISDEIKVGDVVWLKGGSSGSMVVEGIKKYGMGATHETAKCVWHLNGQHREEYYELTSLTKQNPSTSGGLPFA